ncbi:MAG: carboxypeptidase regulatory-like domain-containing protein [Taibaiella sp.]|nr:carboxypeptidase regulatory-like domain-containing protein [Taibaiella sp.]
MGARHSFFFILVFSTISIAQSAICQTTQCKALHSIYGRVCDDKKEPLPGASVSLLCKADLMKKVSTDFDGFYSLDSIDTGQYYVLFSYVGYDSVLAGTFNVVDTNFVFNAQMKKTWKPQYQEVIQIYCDRRLYDIYNPTRFVLRRGDLRHMPLW